ncbi:doublecortin domain-containing protein 2C isoform X2 [Acipenser ruthenus]|uniref:doublecortin domain-containing protein 2C isoform X2 n=1 Tax=Acipenser ruthenus TaxID=7906 RepID=UPI002740E738|nr:doublecortin domain-containing protein 2C isoform X2 [Acipenser ruthenus]XP_058881797.1 doublecortin domain-containing protein 2C isoform X2 [Acipenser ruthenus]
MSGFSGRVSLPTIPPAKTIIMYRNGDAFFTGRKFVINERHVLNFENVLSLVTKGIEAPYGAVRNVYTARDGHRVLDLEHLQNGERYVAAGRERFKKLDYLHITTKKPQRKKHDLIRPVLHSRIIVSARCRKVLHESCTINVFTNGEILVPPVRVLLPKYTLRNWDRVLAMVTDKVQLRTGAVYRLCTIDGTPLLGSAELENFHYYVAVGAERFKHLQYFQWVQNKGTIRDTVHTIHPEILAPIKNVRKTKDTSVGHSAPSTRDGQVVTGRPGVPHGVKGKLKDQADLTVREEDSFFYAKPVKVKHKKHSSRSPHAFSAREEGGVFKAQARRREIHGATEVHDDTNMKVDLPIDEVAAEVVHEERISSLDVERQTDPNTEKKHSPVQIASSDKDSKQELPGDVKKETKEQEKFSKMFGLRFRKSHFFKDKTKKQEGF